MTSPPSASAAVYVDLTPDRVLDALDSVGLRGDGRILQLNSYENRVFQVYLEDGSVVVAKFYRPGRWSNAQILEEHAFALELADAEVPAVAPLALQPAVGSGPGATVGVNSAGGRGHGVDGHATAGQVTLARWRAGEHDYRFAVAPRRSGRAPELGDPDVLRWIGRFLGRLHQVGRQRTFETRLRLDIDTLGQRPRDELLAGEMIPEAARPVWRAACDAALDAVRRGYERAGTRAVLRLHGDCHPGNLLWSESGPHFVDLDDACTGPAIQDLWMLLSGEPQAMRQQLATLLEGYTAFADFDPREITLIEPLRTLRMIHHSAWIARRWGDPAFPAAFPWFDGPAYWQQQAQQLREQVELIDDPQA